MGLKVQYNYCNKSINQVFRTIFNAGCEERVFYDISAKGSVDQTQRKGGSESEPNNRTNAQQAATGFIGKLV